MMTSAAILAGLRKALGFIFDNGRGQAAAALALFVAFASWFAWENQSIGAAKNAAQTRQNNDAGHSLGSQAARNSNRPGASGSVLDPSTRWE